MKKFILCLVLVYLVNIVAGRAVQKKDEHKDEKPAENQEDIAVKLNCFLFSDNEFPLI